MKTAIEAEQAATTGVSYLSFFKTKGNRKRLYILVTLGLCQQWVGNGIISCEQTYDFLRDEGGFWLTTMLLQSLLASDSSYGGDYVS